MTGGRSSVWLVGSDGFCLSYTTAIECRVIIVGLCLGTDVFCEEGYSQLLVLGRVSERPRSITSIGSHAVGVAFGGTLAIEASVLDSFPFPGGDPWFDGVVRFDSELKEV